MKAKTLQEMKDSGFLELGQVYVERYYTDHCKKILGIKFKYRKRHFKLIRFKSLDDFIYDDSAMVYKNKEGIYVITGCSHSGICNIVEQAKEVSGEENILGVIGGFHLIEKNEQLYKTIEYLEKCNIKEFYPGHCTSYDARFEMSKKLDVGVLSVGLEVFCK